MSLAMAWYVWLSLEILLLSWPLCNVWWFIHTLMQQGGLQGVINNDGILCSCDSCHGSKVSISCYFLWLLCCIWWILCLGGVEPSSRLTSTMGNVDHFSLPVWAARWKHEETSIRFYFLGEWEERAWCIEGMHQLSFGHIGSSDSESNQSSITEISYLPEVQG